MKKKLTALMVLCVGLLTAAALMLTGCGEGSSTSQKQASEQPAANATADNQEITMLVPGYDGGYLKEELDTGIKAFEAANKGMTVKIISVGWDDLNSKIVQLYQAGEAPDIMLTGTRSLRQLVDMGAVQDLSSYITDDFKSKRIESVLKTAKVNGKQYGIPMAFSSRALIYRSDLIATPPTTWDELLATAKKVHEEHPDVYGFAIPTDITSGTDEILNFIYQGGGRIVDENGNFTLNSPENVATLSYLAKFESGKVVPDVVSTSRKGQIDFFKNGNLAMYITGPWDKEELEAAKDKAPYATAELPAGKTHAVTLVTDSYVVSSLSKHKDAAWKFIEFMGQPEYQRPVSEAFGWFPILKAEENDARFQEPFMKPFAALIQYGVAEPNTPNWDTFNKSFVIAVQKALTGQATPQEALDQAQKEVTQK